jgi:hypothetical protein
MYTTNYEGLTNNYAVETKTYYAVFPSPEQQQRYLIQGAFATLLVATVLGIALAVS